VVLVLVAGRNKRDFRLIGKKGVVMMKRRQIIGRLAIGAGIVALLAGCGTQGLLPGVGGVPTTVVGATGGQVTVGPTLVPHPATRGATATRTVTTTPVASPTR
jgi:hypothetical protein